MMELHSTDTSNRATRDAALAFAAKGCPVLPVRNKLPLTAHGVHDASTDEAQIRDWWKRWPDAGVAVATGASSHLAVLDVDGLPGAESLAALERKHGALPQTLSARTGGGGRHIVFRLDVGQRVRCSAG